jgi:hypothetical protein
MTEIPLAKRPLDSAGGHGSRRERLVPVLGLALLVLALLPLRLWRASLETSLWIDETASLVLANQPVGMILDTAAIDTNPPGYYLLLKAWLKAGRALGLQPGILWARLLGVLAWVALAVTAWSAGKRLFGSLGTVLAVAVAGSSYSAVLANDARGYSIASVALFACFLILLRSYQEEVLGGGGPTLWRSSVARWLLYSACATAALWTHLLSLLILACLALLWLILLVRARAWTSGFARFGAVAQLAALLLFLPWLAQLKRQVAGLQASAPTWMTPPTGLNLSSVFWWWYPFGRVGDPHQFPTLLFPVLGVLSVLLPLSAAVGGRLQPQRAEEPHTRMLGLLAYGGLGVSFVFVILLWEIQRLGVASVFYAPRYPALSAALWGGGLVGLAGLAGARTRRPGFSLWGLLIPWITCSLIGQWWAVSSESQGGLDAALARQAQKPPPGTPLYAMPSELAPFYRRTLSQYRVRRIEDLPCGLASASEAWVLNLSPWRVFDRPRDLIVQRLLAGDALAGAVQRFAIARDYDLHHLSAVHQDAAAALCRRGIQPTGRLIPPQAASVALPEEQRYTDGWSYPEVSGEGGVYRWAATPTVTVRFGRALPAGDYVLHYEGYRSPHPEDPARMAFDFDGSSHAVTQPAGGISLQLNLHLEKPVRHPLLVVHHPLWSPAAAGSSDTRKLASALSFAWFEHFSSPGCRRRRPPAAAFPIPTSV